MAYLKNLDSDTLITKYVSFNKTQEITLSKQVALDGTEYLTRFGAPVYSYTLEVYVNDAGKELLMTAADLLNELEVKVRIGSFRGRIKSMDDFERVYYGWYKTNVILSAANEVNTP